MTQYPPPSENLEPEPPTRSSADSRAAFPEQPPSEAVRPWYQKKRFMIPAALLGLFIAIGAIAGGGDDTPNAPAADAASAVEPDAPSSDSTAAAEASASAAAAEAASAAAAAAEAEAAAAAATQSFSGSGADVVTFTDFGQSGVIATISHEGSRNFAVWSVDSQGENLDLLVNVIGAYSGVVPLNFSDDPAALKIEADGAWTVATAPLTSAPRWDGTAPYTGQGDSVVVVADAAEGLTPVTITNAGDSNFSVWAWGDKGRDLLVNEIGNYDGRMLVPSGTLVLVVGSDGQWSIAKS